MLLYVTVTTKLHYDEDGALTVVIRLSRGCNHSKQLQTLHTMQNYCRWDQWREIQFRDNDILRENGVFGSLYVIIERLHLECCV